MNAFPVNKYEGSWDDGMSLRDYFAGQAMLSVSWRSVEASANSCYEIADAMMKARETK